MTVFTFRDRWTLPADVGTVFGVLADIDRYPLWWPQVRRAERIDADRGHAFVRSLMPWTLDLVLTREVEDPVVGLLRVGITGDLEGWCQWRLTPGRVLGAASTVADFSQEAVVTAAGLSRLAGVAAPVMRANHDWMMRGGRRGLVAHLRAAAGDPDAR